MSKARNFLFIMCDQLRADYLSCYGHPHLQTPHIDSLAARGLRFEHAYCQSPICGPSRMSFYTGRYLSSHGSTLNGAPLPLDELTLGDYLRPLGVRTALIGKTHHAPDSDAMARLGIAANSQTGIYRSQCGFEPFERDDGLYPGPTMPDHVAYKHYLHKQGYGGANPWHDYANSAEGPNGKLLSGWHLRNAGLPARVAEAHSETAYMTDRAIAFIDQASEQNQPWCAHLSYIKPHWPYLAPAPYNALFGADAILPANRTRRERELPHPVIAAFMRHQESESFARDEVRETVIPAYMGLVKQLDDHIGRLLDYLTKTGRLDDTLIIFTSDHGDYLGDHWLGEKELFHEASVRIPLIIVDPDSAADTTRGQVERRLVEAIDVLPTLVEAAGGEPSWQRLEGRSLLPLARGDSEVTDWRPAAVSEVDYSLRPARRLLGLGPTQARAYMVRTERWKYILYEGFPPQLFDLENDPNELNDLGAAPNLAAKRAELRERLFAWLRQRRVRVTLSDQAVDARTGNAQQRGFLIGVW